MEFACKDNYTLSEKKKISCEETKDWSSPIPKCWETLKLQLFLIMFPDVTALYGLFGEVPLDWVCFFCPSALYRVHHFKSVELIRVWPRPRKIMAPRLSLSI